MCVLLFFWVKSLIISCTRCFSGCLHDETERKHFLAVSWSQYLKSIWRVWNTRQNHCLSLSVPSPCCCSCPFLFSDTSQHRGMTLLRTSVEMDMKAPQGDCILVGVSTMSRNPSPWRQDYVSCPHCSLREGSAGPTHASVPLVNVEATSELLCSLWRAQKEGKCNALSFFILKIYLKWFAPSFLQKSYGTTL